MTTAKELRNKVVTTAQKYLGAKQGSKLHKKIIDTFNTIKPDGWAMTYDAFWCAAFASGVAIEAVGKIDAKKYFPLSANCGTIINRAKKLGIWVENDAHKPSPADWLLYDWGDTTGSKGDNKGAPDHVGIVEKVTSTKITVIEGNMRNAAGVSVVGRRTLPINGNFIRGFVTPKYEAVAKAKDKRATDKRRKLIADKATEFAYKDNPKKASYPGGKPKKAYKDALNKVYPDRKGWGAAPRAGASCDVCLGTIVRSTGLDKKFPRAGSKIRKYMDKSKKFSAVKKPELSDLMDGDIITYRIGKNRYHYCVYVDGKIIHAAYKKRYPVTTNTAKTVMKKPGLKVYRAK